MGSALQTAQSAAFAGDMARNLGLSEEPPTIVRQLGTSWFAVSRLACAGSAARHQIWDQAQEDAFVVSLHLRSVRQRLVWIDGQQVGDTVLPANVICLYDLQSVISAQVDGPFDVIQFRVPRTALDCLACENDMPRLGELGVRQGAAVADPTVKSLGRCLLTALEDSQWATPLFVDELALALEFHLIQRYGGGASPKSMGGLAPWQQRRATELMTSDLSKAVELADIARECRLSASHFARAFRQSMGLPPYKWRLDRRVMAAKEIMLNTNRSLREIAMDCGFTDQSHLTRVFTGHVGTSPAAWRRNVSTCNLVDMIESG